MDLCENVLIWVTYSFDDCVIHLDESSGYGGGYELFVNVTNFVQSS